MTQIKVASIMLGLIADCCLKLNKVGIHHLHIEDCHLQANDRHRDLYINIGLPSSDISAPEQLQLSIEASINTAKLLRSVGKRGGDVYVETVDDNYLFKDDFTQVEIKKITVKAATTTVTGFVDTMQLQGAEISTISSRGELSLTGNEPYVLLGVYGNQLASLILPDKSERFFQPQVARQMKRLNKETYKCYGFLKFGTQDYKVSLYANHNDRWLLTEGKFSDAIPYQVLEKLTSTT